MESFDMLSPPLEHPVQTPRVEILSEGSSAMFIYVLIGVAVLVVMGLVALLLMSSKSV